MNTEERQIATLLRTVKPKMPVDKVTNAAKQQLLGAVLQWEWDCNAVSQGLYAFRDAMRAEFLKACGVDVSHLPDLFSNDTKL